MEIAIICAVAFFASMLTFFSGFGLGTILTPAMVLFFPVEVAIALTGIVHLLNNLFKITLVYKNINWKVGYQFGSTAIIGAFIGAFVLLFLTNDYVLYSYTISNKTYQIIPVKLTIAVLMMFFALLDIVPLFSNYKINKDKLWIGGFASGFFGGLSGNQGALRSVFLLRCGLTKESFIATGILIACVVDFTRLSLYFSNLGNINLSNNLQLLTYSILAAFLGAFLGSKLLKKVTLSAVQHTVAIMIFILATALGSGII